MTMRKRSWKDWAVDFVRRTGKCPGDVPAMGRPTDMLTEAEFALSLRSLKLHLHKDCHLVEDILGLALPGMEIETDVEPTFTETDVEKLKEVSETREVEQIVEKVKRELHVYVDLIKLKEEGVLYVPQPLLQLQTYIKTFFDTD